MGYQQGGPPQGYQPAPQPQPSPIDFNALLSKLSRGDMIVGASLLLLLIFSFIGAWFHASYDVGSSFGLSGASSSVTYGTLWGGLGILAALLLLVAIAFYVVRLIPQIQIPALPLPDWQLWTVFGIAEIVLFFLNWLIGKGSYNGVDFGDLAGVSKFPGWAFFAGVILAAGVAVGGYLKQQDPVATTGGGAGGYGGGGYAYPPQQPPQGYAAPPPAYPAQPPYADPTQTQQYPPQQYPPQQYPPQQPGGYPPQPPPGSPPQ